jgi:DNA (cytosine-5)-methyltransferase 1
MSSLRLPVAPQPRRRARANTRRSADSSKHRLVQNASGPQVASRLATKQAIDLYGGVGGWTLGLKMAGIETVGSYEWWAPANRTRAKNFGIELGEVDIRKLKLSALPPGIRLVVGSPPCTEFSFANRGGSGDIADGLRDVRKFLEIVEHLRPQHWVMENVPRVAGIIERELAPGGRLRKYAKLVKVITVIDMADFGLPQSRKRMLAGDFPLPLLESYKSVLPRRTLGTVLAALSADRVTDPIYGIALDRAEVTGTEREEPLTEEEVRMNRDAKRFHPVYNRMSFPDGLDRPARTVTATCTRVSRESIVLPSESAPGAFRRLTLRERASLQGFPITFQFWGENHNDNLTMVGNAIPPLITYYIAHSVLGTKPGELPEPSAAPYTHLLPKVLPPSADLTIKTRYPSTRRFRAAIPELRFGSGVRFEMVNKVAPRGVSWSVDFYFGTSKKILRAALGEALLKRLRSSEDFSAYAEPLARATKLLERTIGGISAAELQDVWTHRSSGRHPYAVVDALGAAAKQLHDDLVCIPLVSSRALVVRYLSETAGEASSLAVSDKLTANGLWLLVGFAIGSWFNTRTILAESGESLSIAV